MSHHVDQLRYLLTVIEPAGLAMADRLAVLEFARRMFPAKTAGGGGQMSRLSVSDGAAP